MQYEVSNMSNLNKYFLRNLILFITILFMLFFNPSCKIEKSEKPSGATGIIIFQIGTVKIHHLQNNKIVDA